MDLIENPWAKYEDKADNNVPTATYQIYSFIGDYLTREQSTHVDRASSAGMCVKRRWFQRRGIVGTPMTPRKEINFLLGDLAEKAMLFFISKACVGPGKLYSEIDLGEPAGTTFFQGKEIINYKQKDLSFQLDGLPITAHADGFGKRNSDNEWELIECKSASNYGFDDFKKIGPKDYLKQSHALMMTDEARKMSVKSVRFFFLRKETGHLWDRFYEWDVEIAKSVVKDYRIARRDEEPARPFNEVEETFRKKPTGRKVLPFPCAGYCSYTGKCFPGSKIEWKEDQFKNMKPIFIKE
jgi:hypothetical protein